MSEQAEQPKIKSRKQAPCGCLMTEFEDGRSDIQACLPCALSNAGIMLQQAAQRIRDAAAMQMQAMNEELRRKLKL